MIKVFINHFELLASKDHLSNITVKAIALYTHKRVYLLVFVIKHACYCFYIYCTLRQLPFSLMKLSLSENYEKETWCSSMKCVLACMHLIKYSRFIIPFHLNKNTCIHGYMSYLFSAFLLSE